MELSFIRPIGSLWWGIRVLEGIRERERVLGYSEFRVLAQLGFDLTGFGLAWLGWAVTKLKEKKTMAFPGLTQPWLWLGLAGL